jgi:hypothetical protein
VIDYLVGDPVHFAMERKMMLGLKQRTEPSALRGTAASVAEDAHHPASSRHSP